MRGARRGSWVVGSREEGEEAERGRRGKVVERDETGLN